MDAEHSRKPIKDKRSTAMQRAADAHHARKRWYITQIEKLLANSVVQASLTTMLFVSLYLPDIWLLINPPNSSDVALNVLLFLSFGLFVLEFSLLFVARKEYRLSFFCFMDILGTLSILLDITMIGRLTTGVGKGSKYADATVLRAARLAKIGAKSGRLAKLVRVFRLLFSKKEAKEDTDLKGADVVSAQLSKMLAQRVAGLVMIMLVLLPVLQSGVTDVSANVFVEVWTLVINMGNQLTAAQWEAQAENMWKFYNSYGMYQQSAYQQPLYIGVTSKEDSSILIEKDFSGEFDEVRSFNVFPVRSSSSPQRVLTKFNVVRQTNEEARNSILIICMVIILLLGFAASFNHSVENLVVNPLKRIITSLRESTMIALESVNASTVMDEAKEAAEADSDDEGETVLETDLLEIMVAKLARIVNRTTATGNKKYIENMNLDANTADWLNDFLPEDTNSPRANDTESAAPMMRNPQSRTSMIQTHTKETKHLNDWHLDPMELDVNDIRNFISFIFHEFNVLDKFQITDSMLSAFLGAISTEYKADKDGATYHNWLHAFDVTHTLYRFIRLSRGFELYTSLEILSALVAVVAHDVGHPGVNNHYLVITSHPLATLHNDRSPLENMHAATLYVILRDDKVNVLKRLTEPQWREARKHIIDMILNTDMTNHFDNVSKLQVMFEIEGAEFANYWQAVHAQDHPLPDRPAALNDVEKRMMLLDIMLHAADISNPIKPFKIYEKWADRVMEEFFLQGDKERGLGLEVVPMYNRELADKPNAQIGFIEFIVAPLYLELLRFAPGLDQIITNICDNHKEYCEQAASKLESAEEPDDEKIAKMKAKPDAFRQKFIDKLGEERVKNGGASESNGPSGRPGRRKSTQMGPGGGPQIPPAAGGKKARGTVVNR